MIIKRTILKTITGSLLLNIYISYESKFVEKINRKLCTKLFGRKKKLKMLYH